MQKVILDDAAIIDAKERIDKFNRETNYSKSIIKLEEYMEDNPLFKDVQHYVITKKQQTADKKRGLYVLLPDED